MDFKIGDIVKIKGGVDEWEVESKCGEYLDCRITKDCRVGFHESHLELVRRPSAEKKCEHKKTIIWEPHLAGARKCTDCGMVYNPNMACVGKPVWFFEERDETPNTGQENVIICPACKKTFPEMHVHFCEASKHIPWSCSNEFSGPVISNPVMKKKVERWQWVYQDEDLHAPYTASYWMTKSSAEDWALKIGAKLIGRDPNCLNPLITEE